MLILLVHGLGRTPLSLFGMAAALRRRGHHTRFFGYSSTFETVPHIVHRLATRLRSIAARGKPIGLIGHSMGGLFVRMALVKVAELRVHHFVTLGTPTSVPRMARHAWRWFFFRLFARDCGRFLTSSQAFASLPPLCVPHTVIAGTAGPRGRWSPFGDAPNDGVVAVEETQLNGTKPELFPVLHTLMMNAVAVHAQILVLMESNNCMRSVEYTT